MHLHILYMHARNEVYTYCIRQEKIIASRIGNFEKRAIYRISIRRKDCTEKWYRWWNKTTYVVSCRRLFLTRADFTCTWQSYTSGNGKEKGVFHSTKISRNSSSKLNGTKGFLKFVSKILVNLSRSNPYFWKSGNSRNFLFYNVFVISTWYDLGPSTPSHEFCFDQSYKILASMQNDLPQFGMFLIA